MTATGDQQLVSQQYDRADLGATLLAALQASGKDPARLTPDDLTPVDQFHIGGKDATRELMRLAGLERGMEVLDVGGGLGGPARTLATELDCRVTVLDLSQEYCRAGEMLTERTGLSDRVTFRHGDALDLSFPDERFDVVWTQHSSMNVDDKERLYAEIRRVLRPAGRLALHEIMAGSNQPVHFPVPWAGGPAISFLRSPAEARGVVERTGFDELAWVDVTATALDWWRERRAAAAAQPAPPPFGLHLLLGLESKTIVQNTLRNLEEGRTAVIQGVFARRSSEPLR